MRNRHYQKCGFKLTLESHAVNTNYRNGFTASFIVLPFQLHFNIAFLFPVNFANGETTQHSGNY